MSKVYIVMWDDYTISGDGGLLGVYDNKDAAEKRAKEFSDNYIGSDEEGPLGVAYVVEYSLNEKIPGCPAEAYEMET